MLLIRVPAAKSIVIATLSNCGVQRINVNTQCPPPAKLSFLQTHTQPPWFRSILNRVMPMHLFMHVSHPVPRTKAAGVSDNTPSRR